MAIPKIKELYLPILNLFSDSEVHTKIEIYGKIIEYFKLTEADLNQTMENSNISKFDRRFNLVVGNFVNSNCLVRKGKDKYSISYQGLKLFDTKSIDVIEDYLKKHAVKKFDNNMTLSIKHFGAISDSNIDIKKINVIGGLNATGKSTASKLLYCFLKYNSSSRQTEAYESVIEQIRNLILMMRRLLRSSHNGVWDRFIQSNFSKFLYDDDIYDILIRYDKLKDIVFSEEFNDSFSREYVKDRIFTEIREIDTNIDLIEEDGDDLFNLIMNDTFKSEFSNEMRGYAEFNGSFDGNSFEFIAYSDEGYQFYQEGALLINDIFYIDSFSSLDIYQSNGLNNTKHVQSLLKSIENESDDSKDLFDPIKNSSVKKLLDDINGLIGGKLHHDDGELKFSDEDGNNCYMSNTASGIKQIGIIQMLLSKRKLKNGSFLIIDEPEVNLHPEWQIKFAEILCRISNELNVYIYINTHSPMFIEAMSIYSNYFYLNKDANFYLTKKQDKYFKFEKISNDDMGAVYENLSRPYDDLDEIKAEILYRD